FAPALSAAALAVWAVRSWGERPAWWAIMGAAVYLVGAIGVTAVGNLPLNDTLAVVAPDTADASAQWDDFYGPWLAWNHVRTVAALTSACLFANAARLAGPGR
ncbi:MAG: anthrone oxygenase family protein, partial [Pseudonocardiaceae bacterium]